MTAERNSAFSRRHAPEFCKFARPPKQRGRREDRVRAAPAVSCAKVDKKNAHEHTGSAETLRPSLRNGSTAYIVLSPARPGLLVTVIPRKPELLRDLTPAIGASGPHDFAVRSTIARLAILLRPSHPTRAFRDVRNAPLDGWDAGNTQLIWVKNKAEYFSRRGWTGFRARR
jgi:hypothetical protein